MNDFFTKAVARARNDPNWFCDAILRSPNDDWQREMMEVLADVYRKQQHQKTVYNHRGLNKISIRSPHNPGKTHYLAKSMHWFNFCFRGRIVATAPKEEQLTTRLWPEFRKVMQGAIPGYSKLIDVHVTKIFWAGDVDWCALAETAATGENLAGHHWKYLLIIVDEASGVREELFPVIEAALADAGAEFVCLIMIGNPTRTTGSFHASHCRDKIAKQYYHRHIKPEDSHRISKSWIKDMITKYGKDSPVVKVRCLGEFADTEEDQLITIEWLQNARDREFKHDGSLPRFRVSVDVADGGTAQTVVIASRQYDSFTHWIKMKRYSFPPARAPILAAEAAVKMFKDYKGKIDEDDFAIDGLGVGAGTCGAVIHKGYQCVRYIGGGESDNPKKWRNRRVQSYMVMRDQLQNGLVVIAPDFCDEEDWEDFEGQMCSIKSKPGLGRIEDLLTKAEIVRGGIVSPDMPDSVSMIYATQVPELVTGDEPFVIIGELESAQYESITQ